MGLLAVPVRRERPTCAQEGPETDHTPRLTILPASARDRWDTFVADAGGHAFQTWGWGDVKAAMGWTPWRIAWEEDGRICAGVSILSRAVPGLRRSLLYAPRGPVVTPGYRNGVTDFLASVCRLDVARRSLLLKMDPAIESTQDWISRSLTACGFRPAPPFGIAFKGIQPQHVFQIDITPTEDDLWRRLHKVVRRHVRASERRGMTVREGDTADDVRIFHRLLRDIAGRRAFLVRSEAYFQAIRTHLAARGQAQYFVAEVKGEPVAAGLALAVGRSCWYLYMGSSAGYEHARTHMLQWRILLWAKARRCTVCHLGGIPAGGATVELHRFKTRFGATAVDYVGEFDYSLSPVRYSIWTRLLPGVMRVRRSFARLMLRR